MSAIALLNTAVEQSAPGIEVVKAKMKATWSDGDYASFAKYMESGAVEVLDAWNIGAGLRVIDVGCGSGQTAIPLTKRGAQVVGVDIADNLIEVARKRAAKARLSTRFDVGDAEALPYPSNNFDAAISMFGAMFAPRPQKVTAEFSRVLKSGGRLYMANWASDSMPAQMFKRVAQVNPPAPGVPSPILWGDEQTVYERLSDDFTDIQLSTTAYPSWQYPFTASDLVDLFRAFFGPVKRAFEALDVHGQAQLHDDLEKIYRDNSQYENGVLTITGGRFLDIRATKR